VEAAPWVAFRPLIGSSSFSVALFGWASNTGETGLSMNALLGTKDAALGRGVPNGGQYSNARLDTLIEEAMGTIDDNARGALLAEATELAMQDVALIPLFYAVSTWACRNSLQFDPPSNEYTTAMRARPA
jgi:peptide/nickel transport system substrate-binding protein